MIFRDCSSIILSKFIRGIIVTSPLPEEITLLLQRGIAAARSGQAIVARQMLQQVIKAQPDNEMAWLWLSGLMTTDEQKRACLEKVLEANPENVYARAGLTRLQDMPQIETGVLEACLDFVTSEGVSAPPIPAPATEAVQSVKPAVKRLNPTRPTNENQEQQPSQELEAATPGDAMQRSIPAQSRPAPKPASSSAELMCPACDEPVSPTAKMCPYCFMPFKSVEELLGIHNQAPSPAAPSATSRKRRGILAFLGFSIGV
jgi:hypothetical protein